MGDSFLFGEIPVEAKVHSAQHASPEALVALADEIWGKVRASGVAPEDGPGNEALLGRLQREHRDFTTSFPIVVRWMVQAREYDSRALRGFLLRHASKPLANVDDFLELQADYLVALRRRLRGRGPAPSPQVLAEFRAGIVRMLQDENKKFHEFQAQAEAEAKALDAAADRDRRRQLVAVLLARRAQAEAHRPLSGTKAAQAEAQAEAQAGVRAEAQAGGP